MLIEHTRVLVHACMIYITIMAYLPYLSYSFCLLLYLFVCFIVYLCYCYHLIGEIKIYTNRERDMFRVTPVLFFLEISDNISETVQDGDMVAVKNYRKSYVPYIEWCHCQCP